VGKCINCKHIDNSIKKIEKRYFCKIYLAYVDPIVDRDLPCDWYRK